MSDLSSSSSSSWPLVVTTFAAAGGITLSLFQLDFTSRFLLNPMRLQSKRHLEYRYRWSKYIQKAIFFKRKHFRFFNDTKEEELQVDYLDTSEEIHGVIQAIVADSGSFDIVAMEQSKESQEVYLYFVFQQRKYQVSLVEFGLALESAMQDKLTSMAFCFVADASSGYGLELITTLVKNDLSDVVSLVPQESCLFWMTLVANLARNNLVSSDKLERILYGFCRLEASRFQSKARTVLFVLPGQACVPKLLPLLQQAFPCERHVFIYSGCDSAVQYALSNKSMLDKVLISTPMSVLKLRGLPAALAKLPLHHADTVETWMIAIDTYFTMKDNEKTNNYLPFCCKLDNLKQGAAQQLALTNLLQFMTGSKSRPLAEPLVDAAMETLRTFIEQHGCNIKTNQPNIQNCVFMHKSILIENKTLVDTVSPSKEWTLKAAKRISGCLCCGPEEEDEDEDDVVGASTNYVDGKNTFAFDPSNFSTAATIKKRPNYVDGKNTFAFDPTKFG